MGLCRQILQQGLQELNITTDENKTNQLLSFILLIEKWNKTYNLTAVRKREDAVRLHLLDSLTVLPFIQGNRVADIGTGAGLPGIPLAIFLPNTEFVLIDSNAKKTRFVQQTLLELNLKNIKVIHSRVENLKTETLFSTIIMRAFASLPDIISLTSHLLDASGILLAMKGQEPNEELVKMTEKYSVIPVNVPGVEAERCLIQIQGMTRNG